MSKSNSDKLNLISQDILLLGFWLCFVFAIFIFLLTQNSEQAIDFANCYLVELTLSIDNVFVFIIIFRYFAITGKERHLVLFYGVISAIIMRMIIIMYGVKLVQSYHWIIGVFGLVLVYASYKTIKRPVQINQGQEVADSFMLRFLQPLMRFFKQYIDIETKSEIKSKNMQNNCKNILFIGIYNGKIYITRMMLALILIEKADLLFAIDSIPVAISITNDPFVIFAANITAVIVLRSIYVILAHFIEKIRYLHYSIAFILAIIGCKMVLSSFGIEVTNGIIAPVILVALAPPVFLFFKNRS